MPHPITYQQGFVDPLSDEAHFKTIGMNVLNTDFGLRRWRAAIAQLNAGKQEIVNLNFVGDSITEGASSGNGGTAGGGAKFPTNGFVGRIRSALTSKFQDCGMGMWPSYYPTASNAWTLTGSWSINYQYGVSSTCEHSTTNGDTASWSFNGTGVSILVTQTPSSGTFNVSVDGGAAQSFSANNSSVVNVKEFQITGLTSGSHTLTITNTGASGTTDLYLLGAYELTSATAGVRVNMCARSGAETGSHITPAAQEADVNFWSPVLTVVALGANDYKSQLKMSVFRSNLQTIVSNALNYGDCLLVADGLRGDVSNPSTPQIDYINTVKQVALENNCVFLDVYHRWSGDFTYANQTLNFIGDGAVHPNDYGHQDMTTFILNTLLETR